jgi:ABC-type transporter Mla subunit MlaD
MALQDLTPQLRTRLSRMERAVGWFVFLAVALLVFGFAYYIYNAAERRGWFRTKAPYFTFTSSASGLKVGDPVTLMGLGVGQITQMEPMAPEDPYNMYVEFEIRAPYYGYLWTEGSRAIVAPASFLGGRNLEVTKGTNGYPTYVFHPLRTLPLQEIRALPDLTNWVLAAELYATDGTTILAKPRWPLTNLNAIAAAGYTNLAIMDASIQQKLMTGIWNDNDGRYDPYSKGKKYWLLSSESPAVTEQLQAMVTQVQQALPGVFNLTNQLAGFLTNGVQLAANGVQLASNLNVIALEARPAVSNLTVVLGQLNRPGALGEWLLPTNLTEQLQGTLVNANTNLAALAANLNRSLENLALITTNLEKQVAANPQMLSAISQTVIHADEFVQGLKRFWLFRHLFPAAPANPPPPQHPTKPLHSPKAKAD